jgi:hypothetical protein
MDHHHVALVVDCWCRPSSLLCRTVPLLCSSPPLSHFSIGLSRSGLPLASAAEDGSSCDATGSGREGGTSRIDPIIVASSTN